MSARIGIDLGGTKIEGLLIDGQGRERDRCRVATPAGDYNAILDALAGLVARLDARAGGTARVGVAIPGTLSPNTGRVKNANSTCLIGTAFDRDLADRLARPVRIANDADCFALSEAVDGAGAGASSLFGVILGTGVGGGIVVGRRLLAGPNRIAGEWGHNPLPWPADDERPGPACYCGKNGCIETFLSGPGLLADHRRNGGEADDAAAVVRSAAAGDAPARAALERHADRLARALASVINILDPEVIVLGGGLSNMDALYQAVPRRWGAYVFSDRVHTRLLKNRHGDASGVRGAAWLWPE